MRLIIIKRIFLFAWISSLKRWKRLLYHFYQLIPTTKTAIPRSMMYDWPADLFFYIIDVLYLPEWYMIFSVLLRKNIRLANELEEYLMSEYFNDIIDKRFVLFNTDASKLVKRYAHALVTFHIIHFEKELSEPIIVHELVHIHQFQKYGSVYLYRALKAQMSKYTYDYGGTERLFAGIEKGKSLYDYNFEQQASIIEDYYRMNNQFTLFFNTSKNKIYEKYYNDLFV